jgi:hypothetical protein
MNTPSTSVFVSTIVFAGSESMAAVLSPLHATGAACELNA